MRKLQRLAAVGVMAALTIAMAACSNSEAPSTSATTSTAMAAAPTTQAAAADGVTTSADVFGPACSTLPTGSRPGSLETMGQQSVATAASGNPLLTTLATAVGAVPGLADTLDAQQVVTVYAPADSAFDALKASMGDAAFNALLADPTRLAAILQYHVVPKRYDAAGLVAAEKTTELAGGDVTIGGTATAPTLTDGKGDTANVLCGNIPTANATVFVIDKVLMPAT